MFQEAILWATPGSMSEVQNFRPSPRLTEPDSTASRYPDSPYAHYGGRNPVCTRASFGVRQPWVSISSPLMRGFGQVT